MFCGKCGTENEESAAFCTKCRKPLQGDGKKGETRKGAAGKGVASGSGRRTRILIGIGTVAAVIAVVVLVCGGRSPRGTAEGFVDAVLHADGKGLVGLMPKKMENAIVDATYDSRSAMIGALEGELKKMCVLFDQTYPGWEYSCRTVEENDTATDRLERIRKGYARYGIDVSGAKDVKVEITVRYNGKEDVNIVTVPVIKYGRSWYFDFANCDLDDIF